MKKYAILGCIHNYSPKDIKPWVESINKSEFKGKRIVIVYNVPMDTIEYLKQNNFEIYQSDLTMHIFLQRFRDYYFLLNKRDDIDRVIFTDVKDVIFQSDPSLWLENNQKKHIVACSESIIIGDDDWAQKCAGTSFPMEWEMWLKYEESFCAGTIAGDVEYVKDLFLNIYRWAMTGANPNEAADQPAYNCLIKQSQYKDIVQFVKQEEGFATQLGTVLIKKDFFGDRLLEPTPIYKEGKFYNQSGQEFCIVHQYDRNPNIKRDIYERYN